MATTKYQFIDDNGKHKGITNSIPATPEISSKSASYAEPYFDVIESKYDESKYPVGNNKVSVSDSTNYNYRTEYYLLVNNSNGDTYDVGETVNQSLTGTDFQAVVKGFEDISTKNWTWKYNDATTGVSLLTIADCGVTGGTGGPTGPTGGTTGIGTSGSKTGGINRGGGVPKAILGLSSGAQWDVIGISQRISPSNLLNDLIADEVDGVTAQNYTALNYNSTQTINLTASGLESDILKLKDDVDLNHRIFGPTDPLYINTIAVKDTAGTVITINAATGASASAGATNESSELNYLVYNMLNEDATYVNAIETIRTAYSYVSGDFSPMETPLPATLDSVHKIRTLYNTRNP